METTLHQQIKALYGDTALDREVTVDGYRIDAVADGRLIEVQCASLSAFRDKIRKLLRKHDVHVVKPLPARTLLITRDRKGGKVVATRYSPTRRNVFHLFDELVHFVTVFPHKRLTLEVLLVEIEEHRIRRKPRRWRGKNYRVEDRLLRTVVDRRTIRSKRDLLNLLPDGLPDPFHTADIAEKAGIPRWLAQKMAYCLRKTGAVIQAGKTGRLQLYSRESASARRRSRGRAA